MNWLLFLLLLHYSLCSYSLSSIKYTDSDTTLNVFLQGDALIGLFNTENIYGNSYHTESDITEVNTSYYKVKLPVTPTTNRDFIISIGYRSDYYFNKDISSNNNNPIKINTKYLLNCEEDNPYLCYQKYYDELYCISGIRMKEHSVVHLKEKVFIYNGFDAKFVYRLYDNNMLYFLISNKYESSINSFYTDYTNNGYSLNHVINSVYIRISSTFVDIISIDSLGTETIKAHSDNIEYKTENVFELKYSMSSIEECLKSNTQFVNENTDYYSKIFKIYLNYNLIICSDIDIDAIIDPLSLHSLSYFSFISNKELLVLSALFLSVYESQYEVTNNNNILYCNIDSTASNQETITIKNVSPSKEEILNVLFMRNSLLIKSNNAHRFCKSTLHNYSLLPLSINGNNNYYIKYILNQLTSLSIVNIHSLSIDINDIYPLNDINRIYSPFSLHEICVYSTFKDYNVGYCTCDICHKSIVLMLSYSPSKKTQCTNKYKTICSCFSSLPPSKVFNEYDICTDCTNNNDCMRSYYKATCEKGKCNCNNSDNDVYTTGTGLQVKYDVFADIDSQAISTELHSCITCLYDDTKILSQCLVQCLPYQVNDIKLYTYPSLGQHCNMCLLSSEYMQTIKLTNIRKYNTIKLCFSQNIDNFINCERTIKNEGYLPEQTYMGLLTHFRVECPSKPFSLFGSVCIPWFGFNDLNIYTLIYKNTTNNKQWDTQYECMNSNCEPSSKADCTNNGDRCVCYDTCPTGKGRFLNNEEIPCSGNGVCSYDKGCLCDYGYIGNNCEINCSDTDGGCCLEDKDCEWLNDPNFSKCIINTNNVIGYCGI